MSDIIEQKKTRNINKCAWSAKRIWLAMIRCPIWNFDSEVLRTTAGCHPQKA